MLKRILYLGYYFKKLDTQRFKKFIDHVSKQNHKSRPAIWIDIVKTSLKHNTSILEYFNFHFYQIPEEEQRLYAGTGYMYEYQLAMNPKGGRSILNNKLEFLKVYAPFVRHQFIALTALEKNPDLAKTILANTSGKVVLKDATGQCGWGIEVRNCDEFTPASLIQRLKETDNDFVEEFVVQHQNLMKLSPSGLNTIRIITQINGQGGVDIIGARLRITINSSVDNLAAGNIAAPINLDTGEVKGPGVYSDITKSDEVNHPITGVKIIGFQVPFWPETLELVKAAALINTDNRSIGWDVAITDDGPELIEGNHDWCKLLWQLPVKKGLKPILEKYKRELV